MGCRFGDGCNEGPIPADETACQYRKSQDLLPLAFFLLTSFPWLIPTGEYIDKCAFSSCFQPLQVIGNIFTEWCAERTSERGISQSRGFVMDAPVHD